MYTVGMDVDSRAYFTSALWLLLFLQVLKFLVDYNNSWWFDWNDNTYVICNCFLFLFTLGGVTGVILANAGLDVALHDTYYVVAHFHYVSSMGVVFGLFAAFIID